MANSWSNQAVSLILLTEQTTGFSGIFGYSPVPGQGNLIFSVSASAGTDPYGNTYPAGISAETVAGAIQTYAQATAPTGAIVVGSIWLDTAADNAVYRWSGTAWMPYTFGTSAITAGSITATLLQAGIVVAGIVNGTEIVGGSLVADGATGGVFVYSGTPANGNLIGSWAGQAGTDAEGNAYPQGLNVSKGAISGTTFSGNDFTISDTGLFFYSGAPALGNLIISMVQTSGTDAYGNSYLPGISSYLNASGIFYATSSESGELDLLSASSAAGPWTVYGSLSNDGSTPPNLAITGPKSGTISQEGTVFQGPVSQQNPNVVNTTAETWHRLGSAGSTGATLEEARYMLSPDGNFCVIDMAFVSEGTTPGTYTWSNALPSEYQFNGNYLRIYPLTYNADIVGGAEACIIAVDGNGTGSPGRVRMTFPSIASGVAITGTCFVPLT